MVMVRMVKLKMRLSIAVISVARIIPTAGPIPSLTQRGSIIGKSASVRNPNKDMIAR